MIELDNEKEEMTGKIMVANNANEDEDPIGFDDETAYAEMKDYNHMDDVSN